MLNLSRCRENKRGPGGACARKISHRKSYFPRSLANSRDTTINPADVDCTPATKFHLKSHRAATRDGAAHKTGQWSMGHPVPSHRCVCLFLSYKDSHSSASDTANVTPTLPRRSNILRRHSRDILPIGAGCDHKIEAIDKSSPASRNSASSNVGHAANALVLRSRGPSVGDGARIRCSEARGLRFTVYRKISH